MEIERYHRGFQELWDSFNAQAVNGTFFFNRTFIAYHGARFTDHSLLFFRNDKLIALLPLHEAGQILASHLGLGFGGWVVSREVDTRLMLQIFAAFEKYVINQGFTTLIYKSQPYVYLTQPIQDDLFALHQHGATLSQRTILSVLDVSQPLHYSALRQRCLKRAKAQNLTIQYPQDVAPFMNLVAAVYNQAGIKAPTHTVAEMQYLMQAFPENIRLLTAYDAQELVGGVILFVHRQVVNLQYMATSALGKQKHALDLLIHTVINQYQNQKKYVNFGSSQDPREPYQLNQNVLQNKSSYGARGVVQDTYQIIF